MEVSQKVGARYIILHGWDDDPSAGWLGWLQEQLRARGAEVYAPQFPAVRKREGIRPWQLALDRLIAEILPGDVIIAHSLGCWQALRALEHCQIEGKVREVILVAGFYDAPDERASAFFLPEPNWSILKARVERWVCILSRDDTIVTPDRTRALASKLQAQCVELDGFGHFLGSRGMQVFPELLSLIDTLLKH